MQIENGALTLTFPEVGCDGAALSFSVHRTLTLPETSSFRRLPPGFWRYPLHPLRGKTWRDPVYRLALPIASGGQAFWFHLETGRAAWRESAVKEPVEPPPEGVRYRICGSLYPAVPSVRYPFAVQVVVGGRCALTGMAPRSELTEEPRNYFVAAGHGLIDGWFETAETVRQFVVSANRRSVPAASEEADAVVTFFPMTRGGMDRHFPVVPRVPGPFSRLPRPWAPTLQRLRPWRIWRASHWARLAGPRSPGPLPPCGLNLTTAGARIRQAFQPYPFRLEDWDQDHARRVAFVFLDPSEWREISGRVPPDPPPTPEDYAASGLRGWYSGVPEDGGDSPLEDADFSARMRAGPGHALACRQALRRLERDKLAARQPGRGR